jgi:hypothetical protein
MPRYFRVNFIAGKPPKYYRAFEPIDDDVELPNCAPKYRISEEEAERERETEAEREQARKRRRESVKQQEATAKDTPAR